MARASIHSPARPRLSILIICPHISAPKGVAQLDMISKVCRELGTDHTVPLLFIDTLYHFDETLDLARRSYERYKVPLLVYKPAGCDTVQDFESRYGKR